MVDGKTIGDDRIGKIMILRNKSPSEWGEAVNNKLTYVAFTVPALALRIDS